MTQDNSAFGSDAFPLWRAHAALFEHMRAFIVRWSPGGSYPAWVGEAADDRRYYDWCLEFLRQVDPDEPDAWLAASRRVAEQVAAGPPFQLHDADFYEFAAIQEATMPGWRERQDQLLGATRSARSMSDLEAAWAFQRVEPVNGGPAAAIPDDPGWPWASVPAPHPLDVLDHFTFVYEWWEATYARHIYARGSHPVWPSFDFPYPQLSTEARGRLISFSDALHGAAEVLPTAVSSTTFRLTVHLAIVAGELDAAAGHIAHPQGRQLLILGLEQVYGAPDLTTLLELALPSLTTHVVQQIWALIPEASRLLDRATAK